MGELFVFFSVFSLIATFGWAIAGAAHGAIYAAYTAPLIFSRVPRSAWRSFMLVPATVGCAALMGGASSWFGLSPQSPNNAFLAISTVLTIATSFHVVLATRRIELAAAPLGGLAIVTILWIAVKNEIDLPLFGIAGWHTVTCAWTALWCWRTPRIATETPPMAALRSTDRP